MDTIDLHLHTYYSDGSFSPEEVIRLAREASLRAISITDHDTVEAYGALPPTVEIELIPGVECKADWNGIEIHATGYFFGCDRPNFLSSSMNERDRRNRLLVEKLNADGIPVSLEELERTKKGVVGRPHIAAKLVELGYFSSVKEAFDQWLGEGQKYYVPQLRQTIPGIAQELRDSGAKPVLAHPLQYELDPDTLRKLIRECADSGFIGMETRYSGYTEEECAMLDALAEEFGLCRSGGSDFHGPRRPDRKVGGVKIPYEFLERLRER